MNHLEVTGLVKRFGGLLATDHLDLRLARGEIHAVIGPNGAGKTTLVGCLLGFELIYFSELADWLALGLETLELSVRVIESSWVFVFAYVAYLTMRHYVWPHVEIATGYPVPSIARTLVSIVIFMVAVTFIYASIFDRSIVSIVAASGALTVVLGFALRRVHDAGVVHDQVRHAMRCQHQAGPRLHRRVRRHVHRIKVMGHAVRLA